MTQDYESQGANRSTSGSSVGADVMDVIARGLETARRELPGDGGELGLFCGFAYGEPGTFCPFFYWHRD